MLCPACTTMYQHISGHTKARVVKTETSPGQTHRIYRCTNPKCQATFHTIEMLRGRLHELITLEQSTRDFADRFHR